MHQSLICVDGLCFWHILRNDTIVIRRKNQQPHNCLLRGLRKRTLFLFHTTSMPAKDIQYFADPP
jgi:hypothetical protein